VERDDLLLLSFMLQESHWQPALANSLSVADLSASLTTASAQGLWTAEVKAPFRANSRICHLAPEKLPQIKTPGL
jgi:ABC-type spermidine/putrescine transport system permease subunit II